MKLALNTINSNPDKAIEAALSGFVLTRKISENLRLISLAFKDRPVLLRRFENALAQMLVNKSTLDGDDLRAVVGLISADAQMMRANQLAFLNFLLRSTEQLASLARDAHLYAKPIPLTDEEIGYVYFVLMARRGVRDAFITFLPERLTEFDRYVEEISAITPPSAQDMAYADNTSDPLEAQLKRASATANGSLRDTRLARVIFRALSGKTPNIDLASDALAEISNPETKAIFSDYLLISRTMVLAAKSDFETAEKRAREISRLEWRAWALMALGTSPKLHSDAVRLYAEALTALEKSSPSALKVDLTFLLAELWGSSDLARASEVVSQAIKTSNQNMSKSEPIGIDVSGFFPRIGKLSFAPGTPVDSLRDVNLPPIIGRLASRDWAQAVRNSQAIEDQSLRVRYKLAISKSVLDQVKTGRRLRPRSEDLVEALC